MFELLVRSHQTRVDLTARMQYPRKYAFNLKFDFFYLIWNLFPIWLYTWAEKTSILLFSMIVSWWRSIHLRLLFLLMIISVTQGVRKTLLPKEVEVQVFDLNLSKLKEFSQIPVEANYPLAHVVLIFWRSYLVIRI